KRSGRTLFVHGAVESSRGGPLKGVRVEVVGQPRPASISDESGQYGLRVPLGGQLPEPSMRFVRDGYAEQRLPIGAAEAAGSDDLIHNVRLDATGPLSSLGGLVTGRDGPPLARAEVQLYSAVLGRRYQAATNRDGLFTLTDVEDSED